MLNPNSQIVIEIPRVEAFKNITLLHLGTSLGHPQCPSMRSKPLKGLETRAKVLFLPFLLACLFIYLLFFREGRP